MKEWISVKERLPELGTRCLVIDYGPYIEIANYCDDILTERKGKYIRCTGFQNEQDEQPSQLYPTHWMPLPELPND